jgi:hypothetical protein
MRTLGTSIFLLALYGAQISPSLAADVVQPTQLAATATLEDVVDSPTQLTGRISNHGASRIDKVQLLVSYGWLWNDDRRTDDTSPGWSEFHTLPITVEPGASAEFSVNHERSRPARDDGQLILSTKIVGYTEWKLP